MAFDDTNDYEYRLCGNSNSKHLSLVYQSVMEKVKKEEAKTTSTDKTPNIPLPKTPKTGKSSDKNKRMPNKTKRTRRPKTPEFNADDQFRSWWLKFEKSLVDAREDSNAKKESAACNRPLYSCGNNAAYYIDLYKKFIKLEDNYNSAKIREEEEWCFSTGATGIGAEIYNKMKKLDNAAYSSLKEVEQFFKFMEENKCIVRDDRTNQFLGLSVGCDQKKYFEENGFNKQNPEGKFAEPLKNAEGHITDMLALRPTLDFWFNKELMGEEGAPKYKDLIR